MQVGKSLGILSLVLQDAQTKEAQEVSKVKAREQRAQARAAMPNTVPRFDPTRPDASLMRAGGAMEQDQQQPARSTKTSTAQAPAPAPAPPVVVQAGKRVEADEQALTSIYRAFREGEEERDAPPVVAIPEPVGFSFGFSLGAPEQAPAPASSGVQHDAGRLPGVPSSMSSALGEAGGDEQDYEGKQKKRKLEVLLWAPVEEYEARAKLFARGPAAKSTQDRTDEEASLRKSRQHLLKDFKRKRREAVKRSRLVMPKH